MEEDGGGLKEEFSACEEVGLQLSSRDKKNKKNRQWATDVVTLTDPIFLVQVKWWRVFVCVCYTEGISAKSLSLSGLTAWLMANVPPFCTPLFINTPSRYSDSHSSSVRTLTHSHTPLQRLHSWIPAWKIATVALHVAERPEWFWLHRELLRSF